LHIPDGYLSPILSIVTYSIAITWFLFAISYIKDKLSSEKIGLLTVMASGVFAAQMLNWPLPGGTSLHFVGGGVLGILLGPFLGSLAMLLVIVVQCLVFHDGGITALGANLINMAILDVTIGYLLFRFIIHIWGVDQKSIFTGTFLGGWMGVFIAGLATGLEIGLSYQFPYGISITLPIMGIWHFILGIIEGLISALVISYIYRKNPELILTINKL